MCLWIVCMAVPAHTFRFLSLTAWYRYLAGDEGEDDIIAARQVAGVVAPRKRDPFRLHRDRSVGVCLPLLRVHATCVFWRTLCGARPAVELTEPNSLSSASLPPPPPSIFAC